MFNKNMREVTNWVELWSLFWISIIAANIWGVFFYESYMALYTTWCFSWITKGRWETMNGVWNCRFRILLNCMYVRMCICVWMHAPMHLHHYWKCIIKCLYNSSISLLNVVVQLTYVCNCMQTHNGNYVYAPYRKGGTHLCAPKIWFPNRSRPRHVKCAILGEQMVQGGGVDLYLPGGDIPQIGSGKKIPPSRKPH